MGPAKLQDCHVSGRIRSERTVCKDSELIHPKDMQRDPFLLYLNYPVLRIILAPQAGTFTGFSDLELLPGLRMEYDQVCRPEL